MDRLADTAKMLIDSLGKHLDDTDSTENNGKCLNCGMDFIWNDGQWRANCPGCGTVILRRIKKMQQRQEIKCWLCMDTGIVTYHAQIDGILGVYGAACPECEAGKEYPHIMKAGDGLLCPPLYRIKEYNRQISKVKAGK